MRLCDSSSITDTDRYSDNLTGAEYLLGQLKAGTAVDVDVSFRISVIECEYTLRRGALSTAYDSIEGLATRLKEEDADVYQRITLQLMKAKMFARAGKAEKGFSVATRAAFIAQQTHLIPLLWEAVGAISNILMNFDEFDAARRLLDAVIPQVSLRVTKVFNHVSLTNAGSGGERLSLDRSTVLAAGRCIHGPSRE